MYWTNKGGKESEELKSLICRLYLCPPFRRQYCTRLRDTSRCCHGVHVMSVPELKCTQYLIGSGIYLLGRNCTGMCLCLATNDCPNTDWVNRKIKTRIQLNISVSSIPQAIFLQAICFITMDHLEVGTSLFHWYFHVVLSGKKRFEIV